MTRIDSYEDLTEKIVGWLKDYYYDNNSVKAFVVGVSGGIDSAVVSSLCARTGLPTYVVCMPLESKFENTRLSDAHSKALVEKYDNVKRIEVELFSAYERPPIPNSTPPDPFPVLKAGSDHFLPSF